MSTNDRDQVDPLKLAKLYESFLEDLSGSLSVATARMGERLGLYKVLADSAGLTDVELAEKTGYNLRMVKEWLLHQGGGQYVSYESATAKWFMSPEQAALLGDESSPYFVLGLHQMVTGMVAAEEKISESFTHGKGFGWGDQHADVHMGCGRFFQKSYETRLISDWLPRIEGLEALLRKGVHVADIGCGLGYSTVTMAEAFPNSTFVGFDAHEPSMEFANKLAAERGLAERCKFAVAGASDFPGEYGVVSSFNCVHDVQHADKAASRMRKALGDEGILLLAEPMAGNSVEENLNGDGRLMAGCSVLCCTPQGMTDGGLALGTVVSDDRLKGIFLEAGFASFARVHSERFTRVFDIRP